MSTTEKRRDLKLVTTGAIAALALSALVALMVWNRLDGIEAAVEEAKRPVEQQVAEEMNQLEQEVEEGEYV